MTRLLISVLFTLSAVSTAVAQEDGSQVILPIEAQTCDLPSAPARMSDTPTYDELVAAKGRVTEFQEQLAVYRECLESSANPEELTEGNQIALNQAHNYSVEMEERVAAEFNEAVRAYKASQEGDG